ncbi:MAG: glycine--tRNA ligase subunit beta, partial [Alphaproteobacteria bacterium]
MAEFLLELLSEEIPARMQSRAADDLKRLVTAALKDAGLDFESAKAYVTPRRLTLVVDGLPSKQPDVREERRGPRTDAPEKAVNGFLKSVGLTPDQCEQREIKGKTFYFAVIEKKGVDTAQVLAGIVAEAIGQLSWPKSMRWGDHSVRWVRPLHGILCLFAAKVVDVAFGPCAATNTTHGHRFMAPGPIKVKDFADYQKKLKAAYVLIDAGGRRGKITDGATALAEAAGLRLRDDPGLVDEVAGLVEWPVVLMGAIGKEFMELPSEVLITAMRSHQKYFALEHADGTMAPHFIVVSNITVDDGGKAVVAGNERVLRARLADARFFWDQDRKRSLESRVPELGAIVFHAKLGTLAEKISRVEALAASLAPFIPGAGKDRVRSAAMLAKADLVTGMVGEFPELQGVMGRYYALGEGEGADVADAIADHYAPAGPNDACPTAPVSVAVALADKIDSLVGFFAIDETPTGSRDPFALRRAALGVIRLIVENALRLPLAEMFDKSHGLYDGSRAALGAAVPTRDLLDFFADRLKVHLREAGVAHDLIAAVFKAERPGGGIEDDLVRLLARVDA